MLCVSLSNTQLNLMDNIEGWFLVAGNAITKSNNVCLGTQLSRFRGCFGTSPRTCRVIWMLLKRKSDFDNFSSKKHLLWALNYLKTNCSEHSAHATFGMDEKTFRHWKYYMVKKIAELDRVRFANAKNKNDSIRKI